MTAPDAVGIAREARRQQALVESIAGTADASAFAERAARLASGLAAYRSNAALGAERALGAAFPTVRALLGPADFAHQVRRFLRDAAPSCGDLGEWGDGLPAWLERQALLAAWPYLGDGARLDLALHRCERAADATLDAASLGLLESAEPEALRLHLVPGCALLTSAWPIATIHAAHRSADEDPGFEAARTAIAARVCESVFVVRAGWRAVVHRVDAPTAAWTRALLDGRSLGAALDAAGSGFDFAGWLAQALGGGWLQRASLEGKRVAAAPPRTAWAGSGDVD
jgi:hypothetical protein